MAINRCAFCMEVPPPGVRGTRSRNPQVVRYGSATPALAATATRFAGHVGVECRAATSGAIITIDEQGPASFQAGRNDTPIVHERRTSLLMN